MEEPIRIRGHHLSIYAPYLLSDGAEFSLNNGSGIEFEHKIRTYFEMMRTKPDLPIQIVSGIDSICGPECAEFRDICTKSEVLDEDDITLRAYGFQVREEPYTAQEINQVIRYCYERTGFKSPREALFHPFQTLPLREQLNLLRTILTNLKR